MSIPERYACCKWWIWALVRKLGGQEGRRGAMCDGVRSAALQGQGESYTERRDQATVV